MIDIKLSLSIELPGSSMYSTQSCVKNDEEQTPIPEMHDVNYIKFLNKDNKWDVIKFLTRKCIPAKMSINICREAYEYFTSSEEPSEFVKNRQGRHWKSMNKIERLEWHLERIAKSHGGKVIDYHIYED